MHSFRSRAGSIWPTTPRTPWRWQRRRLGYRPENRYVVFQALPHSLGVSQPTCRVLAKAHEARNLGEYEGTMDLTERLVADVIEATSAVRDRLRATGPPPGK